MEIAIIAHDGKKAEMVSFLMQHLNVLKSKNIELVSTGTTGDHVEKAGLSVQKFHSGPIGGDAEIAARVVQGLT
ncbi:MAG: methylglyoxal synthase, partial [Bacteroidales bacterium]|nr:methylglyoxal synthase [Bacteroidales bacterium]